MSPTLRSLYFLSFFLASISSLYAHDCASPNIPMIFEEIRTMQESVGDIATYEMPIYDFNLKDILARMMTQCTSPSLRLCECAQKLENGSLTLPLGDILEIMPEIIKFTYEMEEQSPEMLLEQDRAPRPDAPAATANDAVVGSGTCDLTQVLGLLSAIKKRIQILTTIVEECCAGTFSVLQNIETEISGIFTVLRTLEECCVGTFSVLQTIETDVLEIFTVLNVLEECCVGTFSVLQTIETDVLEIFTVLNVLEECCVGTFSVLQTIETDVLEIFTVLNVLEECCVGTFSVLQTIETDVLEIFTVLNVLEECCVGTFSVLGCFQDIPIGAPIMIVAPGTYCLTNDILGTVTINSSNVTIDLNGFQIIGTSPSVLILPSGFVDITIKNGGISNIGGGNGIEGSNLTNLLITNVTFVNNAIGALLTTATTVTIHDCSFREHTSRAIMATTLINGDFYDNNFQLNTGVRVVEIVNGHNIKFTKDQFNNNSSDGLAVVFITGSFNVSFNDCQINENDAQGDIFTGLTLLNTRNIKIENCVLHGNLGGTSADAIAIGTGSRDIVIADSEVNENISTGVTNGISIDSSIKAVLKNVQANNNVGGTDATGFNVVGSTDVIYKDCFALENISTGNVSGFRSATSLKVIYEECIANDNNATSTGIGFELVTTNTSCVIGCIAKRNQGIGDTGRGIYSLDCINNVIQDNLVLSNFGALIGIGIEISNTAGAGTLSCAVFGNKSQNHNANFIISPGVILLVNFDIMTALLSAVPTNIDNLSIA